MAGIYVHIPFCKKACHYCDFHFSTRTLYINRMVDSICKEVVLKKNYLKSNPIINTIYFGGGTPSLLKKQELNKILSTIKENFQIDKDAEITLEANPDDLTHEKAEELKDCGINRLSIGIQSYDDEVLQWMNRSHNSKQSIKCIKEVQKAGFQNISIDLIYGIPIRNNDDWLRTLKIALDQNVQHISAYCLTIEKKTVFHHYIKTNKISAIKEEEAATQFIMLHNLLKENNYQHYEISNFALANYISKHNSSYWKNLPYLGLGPSAHSYNTICRSVNISNNQLYMKLIEEGKCYYQEEVLDQKTKFNDYVLTALRTIWGLDKQYIEDNFGIENKLRIQRLIENKYKTYFHESDNNFVLTLQGMLLADHIAMNLML